MTPYRDRTFLGILSIILSLSATIALSAISKEPFSDPVTHCNIYGSIICTFGVSIFFAWIAFGEFNGILLAALYFLICVWIEIRSDYHSCAIFLLTFFVAAAMGHTYERIKNAIDKTYAIKSEKLAEEINVLSDSVEKGAKLVYALEEKLNRYSTLKEVAESLSTDLSIEDINALILQKVSYALGKSGRMLLFMVDIKKQELMLSASKEVSKTKAKKGDVFDHWVFRNRKPLIIEDITKDFRFSANDMEEAKKNFRSLIETPLVSENKVIGILRMDSPRESVYTHDDLRILDIIATLGAVAMQNSLLYSRTQELAIKDGLTGLAVRRYFMERFQAELIRTAGKKGELSLLILDIDHFKEYNDQFGHTAGDLVLKHMARSIIVLLKEDGMLGRYGGEEIAILLFGAGKEKAAKTAEVIRKQIDREPFMLRRHKAHITVSIGVASYPGDSMTEEELIRIADERLYKAKSRGRNRVCSE